MKNLPKMTKKFLKHVQCLLCHSVCVTYISTNLHVFFIRSVLTTHLEHVSGQLCNKSKKLASNKRVCQTKVREGNCNFTWCRKGAVNYSYVFLFVQSITNFIYAPQFLSLRQVPSCNSVVSCLIVQWLCEAWLQSRLFPIT